MITSTEIGKVLSTYKVSDLTIGTICSHSALQIFHGARQEGFKTVGICTKERRTVYESFPLACPDHFLIVDEFRDILTSDIQNTLKKLVYPVSHENLNKLISHVKDLEDESDQLSKLQELLSMPGYKQIVSFYEGFMNTLPKTGNPGKDLKTRTAYILRIIDIKGLFSIHEIALREINRAASQIIELEDADEIEMIL